MIKQQTLQSGLGDGVLERLTGYTAHFPRHAVIAAILIIALFAFEIFNFDTTRYALDNLLGPVGIAGLRWASVLALAFCAIDFAGLVRLFSPEDEGEQPREVWFLMGAWLLGATMNALMTWWAVSLTLLNHEFGNEVLSRSQLLQYVPVFVAVLVWLTRILFIGALTVAGNHLLQFGFTDKSSRARRLSLPTGQPQRERPAAIGARETLFTAGDVPVVSDEVPDFLARDRRAERKKAAERSAQVEDEQMSSRTGIRRVEEAPPRRRSEPQATSNNGRVRQRPPIPGSRPSSVNGNSRRQR